MKIVSLLPAATEIVVALDGVARLVGVSHECDFPQSVTRLPRVTSTRLSVTGSAAIHRSIEDMVQGALSIYQVDAEMLKRLRPDIIITQDLCAVCGVTFSDLQQAVGDWLGQGVDVVRLNPHCLQDVWDDITRIAQAIGRVSESVALLDDANARLSALAPPAAWERPRVLTVEWITPFMVGGLWTPELVGLAGGEPLLATAGEKARSPDRDQLRRIDPDMVILKPCGYPLGITRAERPAIKRSAPWADWHRLEQGGVYAVDGNAYFNRSGPRLVDSAEILASLIQPRRFRHLAERYKHTLTPLAVC